SSRRQRLRPAAAGRHATDVLRAVVRVQEHDRLSIRAEMRGRDRTVERGREYARRSTGHVDDAEPLPCVRVELLLSPLQTRDRAAVWTPRQWAVVGPVERRESLWCRTDPRFDDEDIGVVRAIRIDSLRARADERDRRAVGRPRRT